MMLRAKPKTERKTRVASREPTYVGEHLVVDPRVCHGKMTFRGTRVPVETILVYLANGHSLEYLRQSWPEVSAEAIGEAVRLAADTFLDYHKSGRSVVDKHSPLQGAFRVSGVGPPLEGG